MIKRAIDLNDGDEIRYPGLVFSITVEEIVSNLVTVGFTYNSNGENFYGWFNASDMVEIA